jgi:hypothetical protein
LADTRLFLLSFFIKHSLIVFYIEKKINSTFRYNDCRGSLTAGSKFLGLHAGPWTVAQTWVHMIYTGSGLRGVTPYVQFALLCYLR